jgi:aryl-alcohol dehydrogenase-like predicted oxidoreductase
MSVSNKMKYTFLGDSGLKISRICVGCMSFGDRRSRYKWCVEEADALPILEASYKAGINFFDTANGYSSGVSEEILGKAIKKYGFRRENIVVATKLWAPVGHRTGNEWEDPMKMGVEERDRRGYINAYGLSRKHIFDSVDAR